MRLPTYRTKYAPYAARAQQAMPPYITAFRYGLLVRISKPKAPRTARHGVIPRAYVALAVLKMGRVIKRYRMAEI